MSAPSSTVPTTPDRLDASQASSNAGTPNRNHSKPIRLTKEESDNLAFFLGVATLSVVYIFELLNFMKNIWLPLDLRDSEQVLRICAGALMFLIALDFLEIIALLVEDYQEGGRIDRRVIILVGKRIIHKQGGLWFFLHLTTNSRAREELIGSIRGA